MPSALALVIGACVPHIYRSAWRAATARRQQASAPDAAAAAVPANAGTHDAAPGTVIALVASVPDARRSAIVDGFRQPVVAAKRTRRKRVSRSLIENSNAQPLRPPQERHW